MKRILWPCLVLFISFAARSQAHFYSSVKIEYEKTTSVRQLMKDLQEDGPWYQQNKERYPVTQISYFDFTGDTAHSVFKPGRETAVDPRSWYRPVGDKN